MPNWCENDITIRGSKEVLDNIENIIDQYQKKERDNGLLEFLNPIGEWNWDKAIREWGTKWEIGKINEVFVTRQQEDTLFLSFWSANSPPVEAYRQGEKKHDIEITAEWIEYNNAFCGEYKNGEWIDLDINEHPQYKEWLAEEMEND